MKLCRVRIVVKEKRAFGVHHGGWSYQVTRWSKKSGNLGSAEVPGCEWGTGVKRGRGRTSGASW